MISKSPEEFQNEILTKFTFLPYKNENCTIYKNKERPELGYFIKYSRQGYYDFGIGSGDEWCHWFRLYRISNGYKIEDFK